MKNILSLAILLCSTTLGFSQTPCDYQFVDSAGPNGNYSPDTYYTVTFCPTMPDGLVTVTFSLFDTESF